MILSKLMKRYDRIKSNLISERYLGVYFFFASVPFYIENFFH